jgi:hypothetical protein
MGLSLAQIDRLLSEWAQKVDAANQNLLDLYDLPAYQRLSGMGNPPSNVIGITQQQASKALTAIDSLFEDLELLNQQLDRARQLRRKLPALFISDTQLQEIERLLIGRSIDLPKIPKPLAERELFSGDRQTYALALSELLDRMAVSFAIARDIFVAIETAWTELETKLISTNRSIIELQQLAQRLQIEAPASLISIQAQFTSLQLEIERDPLTVDRAFTQELMPSIDRTRQELATLDLQRQQLQAHLLIARENLLQLQQIDRDTISAHTESQSQIEHNLPLLAPLPAQELAEMEKWLERLAAKFAAGTIAPVGVGLTNWKNKLQAYRHAAETALAANRLPLDTRQELRGRLDALCAKALAKNRVEDPALAALADRAHQVLYTSPTKLDLAIDLVRRYERDLNGCLS